MSKNTSLKLFDILTDYVNATSPITIYYNDELIWDDNACLENYIEYNCAIDNFKKTHNVDELYVSRVDVDIVHFHHSILRFYGLSEETT